VLDGIAATMIEARNRIRSESAGAESAAVATAMRFRGALRDLAAALLYGDERHEGDGAVRALYGLRMADAMEALDAVASEVAAAGIAAEHVDQSRATDGDALARWERMRSAADAVSRRCDRLAARLREAAMPIAELDAALGAIGAEMRALVEHGESIVPSWPAMDGAGAPADIDAALASVRIDGFDGETRAAISRAFDALRPGEAVPELQRIRRSMAWRIAGACDAIDVLAGARATPPVTDGLRSACEAIVESGTRDAGMARIDAIAALGRIAERAATLESDGVPIDSVREAMGVIAIGLGLPIGAQGQDDAASIRVIDAIGRIVDDAARSPRRATLDFKDAKFNRAWRAMIKRHEGIEVRAFGLAARIARAPSVLGTPEWVSGAAALRDSRRTIERVASIGAWIDELRSSADGPIGGAVRAGAADRLTVIRRGIGFDEHRDGALAALAEWEAMRGLATGLPGEDLLRAGDARLAPVTRSRSSAVVRVMELARADWVGAWARADQTALGEAERRMRTLERLGAALNDVAALREEGAAALVCAWAGARVHEDALANLRARAEAVVGEACVAAIDGQQGRLVSLMDEWDRVCIAARALARLIAAAGSRFDWPSDEGAATVIAAFGPPPVDAWMLEHRVVLAEVSVWAAELVGADARADRGMADAIVRWMNHLAEPVATEITLH
jgi:hypothetical protein